MKKVTASIIAGALMISAMGINAFAAETATPKITVFGNENSPVAAGSEVSVDVRLSSLDGIKGMDITLAGDANVTLKGIETTGYTENENYTVKDNKIHIVELNSEKTVNLKVKAVAKADGVIKVETPKLAESGTKLAESVKTVDGTIKVATKETGTTETIGTLTPSDAAKYFIPYGSVYTIENGVYKWIAKDQDGNFKNVPSGANYQEFEIPENGITTFGASESIKEKNPQFGTYALNVAGKTCGTMSIVGDWEEFVKYYRENNGLTVDSLVKSVSDYYDGSITTGYTHVILNWGANKKNALKIYKKDQVNWMWKDGTNLQYALRVVGLETGDKCTAVGYVVDSDKKVTFSKIVKTAVKAEG